MRRLQDLIPGDGNRYLGRREGEDRAIDSLRAVADDVFHRVLRAGTHARQVEIHAQILLARLFGRGLQETIVGFELHSHPAANRAGRSAVQEDQRVDSLINDRHALGDLRPEFERERGLRSFSGVFVLDRDFYFVNSFPFRCGPVQYIHGSKVPDGRKLPAGEACAKPVPECI